MLVKASRVCLLEERDWDVYLQNPDQGKQSAGKRVSLENNVSTANLGYTLVGKT